MVVNTKKIKKWGLRGQKIFESGGRFFYIFFHIFDIHPGELGASFIRVGHLVFVEEDIDHSLRVYLLNKLVKLLELGCRFLQILGFVVHYVDHYPAVFYILEF